MPHTILHELAGFAPGERSLIPLGRWMTLVLFAVGGSLIYGASLSLVLPDWNASDAAAWLALSAGLAWCVLIPALRGGTRLSWWGCCDASLLTMAFGEVILVSGALVNVTLWHSGITIHAALINCLIVALSNVVMGSTLALLLHTRGVSISRTLLLWMLALNGSGAVFFSALHHALLAR